MRPLPALAALAVLAAALLLAGCAPTVSLLPGPQATSVGCAGVVVRLPGTLGPLARRATDAQSTAAWGDPAAVTLTCGVRAPEATTTTCLTIAGIDWLVQPQTVGGRSIQVITTFGRQPTTQVVVDPQVIAPQSVLDALADPVASATRRTAQRCLAPSDVPA